MSTLYVSGIDTSIHLASRHLEIRKTSDAGGALQARLPLHALTRVAVIAPSRVSMRAIRVFLRRNIPVFLLNNGGRLEGLFSPRRDADAALRIRQYQRNESNWAVQSARNIIEAKITTARRVLQRLSARAPKDASPAAVEAAKDLKNLSHRVSGATSIRMMRGLEGAASAAYFNGVSGFFPERMPFFGRSRRPPRDPANALLSWTYTIVTSKVRGTIQAHGLDPCIGVYHGLGYGRPALALDLVELYRAPLCDMLVLRLLNLGILKTSDFETEPEHGCRLTQKARGKFFEQYEKRMTESFRLPTEKKETCFRDLIRRNVLNYAKALGGADPFSPLTPR